MATGQSSTESLTEPPKQTPTEALQDALTWREGAKRILGLSAVDSFEDSQQWERDAIAQQTALDQRTISGSESAPAGGEEAEMRNLVGGNQTINHFQQPKQTTPSTGLGTLGKLAIASSLLMGGGGMGAMAYYLLSPDSPPSIDTDTITDVVFP